MAYQPVEGTNNDTINIDPSIITELNSVSFEISINEGTYNREFATLNYINNLFKSFYDVKDIWNNSVLGAEKYSVTAEDPPLPESPVDDTNNVNSGLLPTLPNNSNSSNVEDYYKGTLKQSIGDLSVIESENNDKITSLYKGKTVKVLNYDDEWARIEVNGKQAFIKTKYLDIENKLVNRGEIIISENTNCMFYKTEPNEASETVLPLMNNQVVDIIEYNEESEWIKVSILGQVAYVKKENINVN